ncbi:MAG: translation initiation factor IF-6 [Candidatus Nanohaloarchaea archaeon]|nr:translation initiation factor IF-6 [Candidatus Nanohaloarchaea archaeon]
MAEKHLFLTDYRGDPNIGFYGLATEEFALLAPKFKKKERLEVNSICTTPLCNTYLTGMFASGNSQGVILPEGVSGHELEALEESNIDYLVLETAQNAIGNVILANDKGCVISEQLEEHREDIAEFLDVKVKIGTVAGLDIVGSAGIATNSGVLLHREADEEELRLFEETLDVEGDIGTVNFGSPYVGTGIVANSSVSLVGNDTKGPETARIEKALGFLD